MLREFLQVVLDVRRQHDVRRLGRARPDVLVDFAGALALTRADRLRARLSIVSIWRNMPEMILKIEGSPSRRAPLRIGSQARRLQPRRSRRGALLRPQTVASDKAARPPEKLTGRDRPRRSDKGTTTK